MRIAFVGKGGSGKSTLAALFIDFLDTKGVPILAVDADLNIHLPEILGFEDKVPENRHLSRPESAKEIKDYLRGKNKKLINLECFKKTTPPNASSSFIDVADNSNPIIQKFTVQRGRLKMAVVGTYDIENIGASCYHNNLAIFENILSHLIDHKGAVVADMVAGVDAFANTLHSQFDLLVLVVEPTKRGVGVFEQYQELAKNAGVFEDLVVVANKVRSIEDENFIAQRIPKEKLVGFLRESDYLRRKDREGGTVRCGELEKPNQEIIHEIYGRLIKNQKGYQGRLKKLWDLHTRYVSQSHIRERFGDLTDQIDQEFNLDEHAKKYSKTRRAT